MSTIWRRLIAAQLTSRKLPKKLELSDILDDMDRLWRLTTKDGRERGACIVLDRDDRLKLDHKVVGNFQHVYPMHQPCNSVDPLGFFHTHPLDSDGTEGVFSDGDFAGVLEAGYWLAVVRSGNQMFALVRTERTRPPYLVSDWEVNKFYAVFENYLGDDELPVAEAHRLANHDLCRLLGLAFYAGEFGQPLRKEVIP